MMALVFKAASVLFVALFLVATALLVLTFRRPRPLSAPALLLATLVGTLTPALFALLIRYRPSSGVIAAMAALGLAVGVLWSRATRLSLAGGRVIAQNSGWYLAVWGGIFALTQLVSIVTNRPPRVVMALLVLSAATVVGTNGSLLVRARAVRAGRQAPEAAPVPPPRPVGCRFCRSCGAPVDPADAFCVACGGRCDGA